MEKPTKEDMLRDPVADLYEAMAGTAQPTHGPSRLRDLYRLWWVKCQMQSLVAEYLKRMAIRVEENTNNGKADETRSVARSGC